MAKFCAACGTEVEDTAVFCPTCGQPIDQETASEIPQAPAWPDQPSGAEADEPADDDWAGEAPAPRDSVAPDDAAPFEESTRPEAAPPPPPSIPPRPRRPENQRSAPAVNLPLTMPVMLSGWLIGVGALIAALGVLIGLFRVTLNPIDLIVLVLLLGIAAMVFLPSRVPEIPHARLLILAILLVGFGMALDRIGIGGSGVGELLFFFGTAAAAIGAVLVELGRDQPLGGPQT
ncbi:MAG: zinc-ribbon domain-containing protein [Candidatus Limnocylindria bacterium]